jgi:general secretion pathway protein N
MMGLVLSRRMRVFLVVMLLLGLLLFLPMRVARGLAGLERLGVSARAISGTVWSGRIDQLMLGNMPLGTVRAGLSPIGLFMGRARFDIARQKGLPDDIAGAITVGFGRIEVDDVTGAVPLGRTFAPLPVSSLMMEDVSGYFVGDRCGHAEGRVRARLAGQFPGLNLSQGLSGVAACDGEALLLPLVSQSGLEKITLRLWRSGRYVAEMRVDTTDPTLASTLEQAGFTAEGNARMLKVEGRL